jgi:nicotinamide riboside kinase
MNKDKHIVVNLLGGSGIGKSTCASKIFAKLKERGIECENIQEWVKDMVWEGRSSVFNCQDYIYGKQLWKIFRVYDKVNVVIVDSPIVLSALYDPQQRPHFIQTVIDKFNEFNNMNFYLKRIHKFNPNGRNEKTVEEAIANDNKLKNLLDEKAIEYSVVEPTDEGCDIIVEKIIKELEK